MRYIGYLSKFGYGTVHNRIRDHLYERRDFKHLKRYEIIIRPYKGGGKEMEP